MGRRRGFFAQLARAAAEAQRAERRRQRELLARHRHAERVQAFLDRESERASAELEAEEFRNKIGLLLSVHREATPAIDWQATASAAPPAAPIVDESPVRQAENALATYKRGFFARLFGQVEKQRARLHGVLAAVTAEIERRREEADRQHQEALTDWRDDVALAQSVLAGDISVYDRAIDDSECLKEFEEVGCAVSVAWLSPTVARAAIGAQEADIVPAEEKAVTKGGKLSTKKMPATGATEIYQDFVCGAALRVARELLAVLPLRGVLVDVWTRLLNSKTGHLEDAAVLSVYCPREVLETINFEKVDASDLIGSLAHAMRFSRGKGMAQIEPLEAEQFLETDG